MSLPDHLEVVGLKYLLSGYESQSGAERKESEPPFESSVKRDQGEGSGPLAALVDRAGIEEPKLRHVYSLGHDEEPEIVVSVRRLAETDAEATRQLALLVTGARQGLGLEEWTSASEIREWSKRYSRYDSKNFARTLTEMEEEFSTRGKGVSKELWLTMPGWDGWSSLLTDLAG